MRSISGLWASQSISASTPPTARRTLSNSPPDRPKRSRSTDWNLIRRSLNHRSAFFVSKAFFFSFRKAEYSSYFLCFLGLSRRSDPCVVAFPAGRDRQILRRAQVGQQRPVFGVPAEEDLAVVGGRLKGRVIGAARLIEGDVARAVALLRLLEADRVEAGRLARVIAVEEDVDLRDAAGDERPSWMLVTPFDLTWHQMPMAEASSLLLYVPFFRSVASALSFIQPEPML